MIIERQELTSADREATVRKWLEKESGRLGFISSVDGSQLITLLLDSQTRQALCCQTRLDSSHYHSLTPRIPQCHWYERILADMFGLVPEGHPRLKPVILQTQYPGDFFPLLQSTGLSRDGLDRSHHYLEVEGSGAYEIPVGPIHAGIIEPGHFRFSCLGEVILNLEIQLGYVHRGVEKRMTELPWRKARFVAESAATDSVAAYALAFALAVESLFGLEPSAKGERLRQMALEIERVAMHIGDLIGFAADVGYAGVAATFSRLRGSALRLADLISGSRFMRGFICPGGVARDLPQERLRLLQETTVKLSEDLKAPVQFFLENQVVQERMNGIGRVSRSIARNFGLVGIAARSCGIEYDARVWTAKPGELKPVTEKSGDVMARAKVRIAETFASLDTIIQLAKVESDDPPFRNLPHELPEDSVGLGIVEGHRGELIHLVFTDHEGKICRYAMKDPSVNNWTALPIAIRNNLVADFPLCNKSFSLAYSGHDL